MLTASPGTLPAVRPEAERLEDVGLLAKPSIPELAAAIDAALGAGEPS